MGKVFVGTGSYLPEQIVTNDDIERTALDYNRSRSGTSLHDWVMKRIGAEYRHRIAPGEGTSDMAYEAAQRALAQAGLQASDLDLIVLSTFSSDYRAPNSAGLLQGRLGVKCKFFQIEHACSGFVDATILASALMDHMGARTTLVVSTDAVSTYCDPQLFMMQTVFGDGAGAAILQNVDDPAYGLHAYYTGADGRIGDWAAVPGNGAKKPARPALLESREHYINLQYKKVYPFAVQKMNECARAVAEKAGWSLDEVDWYIPHQTGRSIIEDTARALGQPVEKFFMCIDHTGNTSGATIPIAMDEAHRAGLLQDGNKVVLTAIGAGMAWGGLALTWHTPASGAGAPV